MKIIQVIVMGAFLAIISSIIFVRAGTESGISGGMQTAQILDAAGGATSDIVRSFQGL